MNFHNLALLSLNKTYTTFGKKMSKMFFSRRRTNKCQNLRFPKGEDFWWKSALEGKKGVLLIIGTNLRTSNPNIPPKDIQAGHEFMDRSLKTR